MKSRNTSRFAAALMSLAVVSSVHAERYVVVNKQRLSNEDIVVLERRNCGPVANGHYWYDASSGVWGHSGNPYPQGRLGDNCYRSQRRPSLSERGQLFNNMDWVRD